MHGKIGNIGGFAVTQRLTEPLIVHKKEGLILDDRAAEASTELVAAEFGNFWWIEEIASVECAIAQKLVGRAVKTVCTCLRGRIHNGAAAAVLSAVRVRQRLELSNRIDAE